MELDDLRRHWQQPEPVAPPPLTPRDLSILLEGRAAGLVEKMRRNMWLEAGLSLALALGLLVARLLRPGGMFPKPLSGTLMLVLLLLLAVMLVYYQRLLATLRQMLEPTTSVQRHLTTLAQGLRQLLRFYYQLSVWSGPCTALLALGYYVGAELARPAPMRWSFLAGIVTGLLVLGIPAQLGIVYLTRWYMQRLYGRHLDRLEGQLRELDE